MTDKKWAKKQVSFLPSLNLIKSMHVWDERVFYLLPMVVTIQGWRTMEMEFTFDQILDVGRLAFQIFPKSYILFFCHWKLIANPPTTWVCCDNEAACNIIYTILKLTDRQTEPPARKVEQKTALKKSGCCKLTFRLKQSSWAGILFSFF